MVGSNRILEKIDELPEALKRIVRDGDVVVTMGAGSIGAVAAELPQRCWARSDREARQSQ